MDKVLYIDTTDRERGFVEINGQRENTKDGVLQAIDKLLKRSKTSLSEISEIKVNRGPGSFTSLRIGISIANALNYSLGLKSSKGIFIPKYGRPPNITSPKPK